MYDLVDETFDPSECYAVFWACTAFPMQMDQMNMQCSVNINFVFQETETYFTNYIYIPFS